MIKSKKTIGICALILTLILAISFGIYFATAGSDGNISYSFNAKAEYYRGQKLQLPVATLTVGEDEYTMDSSLVYPDKRVSAYQVCELDLSGKYTLKFQKTIDGKEYAESVDFVVTDNYASMFSYGDNVYLEEQTTVPSYLDQAYSGSKEGLKFTFTENKATLNYNGIVDLREVNFKANPDYYTRTESAGATYNYTNKEFIELLVTPKDNTLKEFNKFTITLTDIYDPDNFMRIHATAADKNYTNAYATYVTVSAKDLYTPIGCGNSADYGSAGTMMYTSFYGQSGLTTPYSFKFFMDAETDALWGSPITEVCYERYIMHEFDNAEVVGLGNEWFGFKTGEVYLSITVDELLGDECSMMIMSVGGKNLSYDYNESENRIQVNFGEFEEDQLPYAVKGKEYPVFDAIAYNTVGGVQNNVKTTVYYGEQRDIVPVINGKFKTEKVGDYFIEYSLENVYGNANKTVKVTAIDEYNESDVLDYLVSDDIVSTARIDQNVQLFDGTIIGGLGQKIVDVKVKLGSVDVALQKVNGINRFKVEEKGTYKVTFTVTDMLGSTVVKEKEIVVGNDTVPYMAEVSMPKAILKDKQISFPKPETFFMSDDGEKQVQLKITVDGVDYTDTVYTATKDFTVLYTATVIGTSIKTEKSYDVKVTDYTPALDMDYGDPERANAFISAFFTLDNFTFTPQDVYTTFNTSTDGASFSFVNKINFDCFDFAFFADKDFCAYDKVSVYLYDSENANQMIKLSVNKKEKDGVLYSMFSLNDQMLGSISGSFLGTSNTPFTFTHRKYDNSILDGERNVLAKLTHFYNGDEFKGFGSGYVYLTVKVEGLTSESNINLVKICNQEFNLDTIEDIFGPNIIFDTVVPSSLFGIKGETFTTPVVYTYDVLDEANAPTLKVTLGRDVLYQGNADKPYSFTLEQVGTYAVRYSCRDTFGNPMPEITLFIFVQDYNAPQVTVDGEYDTLYELNEKIEILDYTMVDDTDQAPVGLIYIETPTYNQVVVEVGSEYTFTEKGCYIINYMARDKHYNTNIYSIVINVR